MQQGSWVDGPGSIQTPTLQLCPVPFPSFSFRPGPMTEPLNTHRPTDTQIRTPPHTNTAPKHTHTNHKAPHTPAHMLLGICTALQSTCFEQSSRVLNPTCSIIYRRVHTLLCLMLTTFHYTTRPVCSSSIHPSQYVH